VRIQPRATTTTTRSRTRAATFDGRRGQPRPQAWRARVQVLEVLQTPEISYALLHTQPNLLRFQSRPSPAKQIKSHNWRISDAARKILAKDWTLGKDEHQSDVFDRVLALRRRCQRVGQHNGTAGRPNGARNAPGRFHDQISHFVREPQESLYPGRQTQVRSPST
jgi:hypothetical protein